MNLSIRVSDDFPACLPYIYSYYSVSPVPIVSIYVVWLPRNRLCAESAFVATVDNHK
jgi:hypothetical protein